MQFNHKKILSKKNVLVLVILFLLSYLFWQIDLKLKWQQRCQLQKTLDCLQKKIKYQEQWIKNKNNFKEQLSPLYTQAKQYQRDFLLVKPEIENIFLETAQIIGLQLESIQVLENSANKISLQISASGNFIQFTEFIDKISHYSLPIVLTDFSLMKQSSSLLQIKMKLNVFFIPAQRSVPGYFLPINVEDFSIRDPFLENSTALALANIENDETFAIPILQIKWAGYIHEGHTFYALAMLPDGKTVIVPQNAQIGIEKAHIQFLNDKEIVLKLFGQTRHFYY